MNKELFEKYASSIKELIDSIVVYTNIDSTIKYTFGCDESFIKYIVFLYGLCEQNA